MTVLTQREVARYSTINAELQSLRDVIDMRNGEIKKQQTRLAELTLKVCSQEYWRSFRIWPPNFLKALLKILLQNVRSKFNSKLILKIS